jgi:hypothetical protein
MTAIFNAKYHHFFFKCEWGYTYVVGHRIRILLTFMVFMFYAVVTCNMYVLIQINGNSCNYKIVIFSIPVFESFFFRKSIRKYVL